MICKKRFGMVGYLIQSIFWTIGYFFGFTLVSILSIGLVVPQEFSLRPLRPMARKTPVLFQQHGKLMIGAVPVAIFGWSFLIAAAILISISPWK